MRREARWAKNHYRTDQRRVTAIQRRVEQQDKRFFSPVDFVEGEFEIYINGIRMEPEEHARAVERIATRKGREEART